MHKDKAYKGWLAQAWGMSDMTEMFVFNVGRRKQLSLGAMKSVFEAMCIVLKNGGTV